MRYETKIVLINPCYRYPNKAYRKIDIVPPLGILYIATVLFNEGYQVSIIDMLLDDIRPSKIKNFIDGVPDVVGISMNFTATADICLEVAEQVKDLGVKHVFVGGNHATFTFQEVIKNKCVDYVVMYQGEQTVLELVETIRKNKWGEISKCKGLIYKSDQGVLVNKERCPMDINKRGIPAWHLLDIFKYDDDNRWSLNTSQGCPCKCTFCSTVAFNKKLCFMTAENIIKLIQRIQRIEGKKQVSISFSDDAFTTDTRRVISLCAWLIKHKIDIIWACSTRVDLVNEELMKVMYRAGCRAILFGIESCNEETLNSVGKKISLDLAENTIITAKRVGMNVKEMFILGLPYETKESVEMIKAFVIKTEPDEVRFGMLAVYPGTPIWYNPSQYGIVILTDSWSDYELLRPCSCSSMISQGEIYELYIECTELYASLKEKRHN